MAPTAILEAMRAGRCRPGVRHVWAGAGLQRAAYTGGAYRGGLLSTACFIHSNNFAEVYTLLSVVLFRV